MKHFQNRAGLCLALALAVLSCGQILNASAQRPPGTLLLNMLTRDEADNLARTLPKWRNIIDAWIIGIDEHNKDNSEEIIYRELAGIPGEIVTVHFDGMGPTWTKLVERGLELFPNVTHGIIADADFAPMQNYLDKRQLDIRCSKHMYTIWTEDHSHERKMDWIYRNMEGVKVSRRVHQTLDAPELPGQEVFQTLIDLAIEEREGGYQDRTGKKNQRYIDLLKKDLVEFPDDPRTLYYLGYAHFDIFMKNKDNPSETDWDYLKQGVEYFNRRIDLPEEMKGNFEEKWFAILKVAEIHERFYNDWDTAFEYYTLASEQDPERADAWFYLGQHFRLQGDFKTSLPYLKKAAQLPIPDRSLFQWHELYNCLVPIEFARSATAVTGSLPEKTWKAVKKALLKGRSLCGPDNIGEVKALLEVVQRRMMEPADGAIRTPKDKFSKATGLFLDLMADRLDYLERKLSDQIVQRTTTEGGSSFQSIDFFAPLADFLTSLQDLLDEQGAGCKRYRQETTPLLYWYSDNKQDLTKLLKSPNFMEEWDEHMQRLRAICR